MKGREVRTKVILRANIREGAAWSEACIVNISERGLGLQAARPPMPGTYIEIRSGRNTVVARVAWANRHRFGVKAQDRFLIDAVAVHSEPSAVQGGQAAAGRRDVGRDLGRALQFASIGTAAAAAAFLLFGMVQQTLSGPLSRISAVLLATD